MKRLIFLGVTFLCLSCQDKSEPIQINRADYHHAMDRLTEVMIHDVFSPPVAARIYAYPNIAAYQVLNTNNPASRYKSLAYQLNELDSLEASFNTQVNLNLAALIAYIEVAKELVYSSDMMLSYRDSLYQEWKQINPIELEEAKRYGKEVSAQIIDWMNKDGYNKTRTMENYNIYKDDVSAWKPTPPAYMDGIEPNWHKLRPFVLTSANQFKPIPHPSFSLDAESDFYKEVSYVYNTINSIREKGDESEEIAIARFWDCNPFVTVNVGHYMFAEKKITPGAHWLGICKIAANLTEADFSQTVYAHTKTSIAIHDAFISCWEEKYSSNLVRPETLIVKYIDASWLPIVQTPPFPEYTSGHSVVSNAASIVLTAIFGDNFYFVDDTELPFGLPERTFDSFYQAAHEATVSRIYGGIHYESAVYNGQTQGLNLGKWVNENLQLK